MLHFIKAKTKKMHSKG